MPRSALRFEPLQVAEESHMTVQPEKSVFGAPLVRRPVPVWLRINRQIGVLIVDPLAIATAVKFFAAAPLSVVSPEKPTTSVKKIGNVLEIVTLTYVVPLQDTQQYLIP